jgi:predicted ribosomally synthesized peptide with nif11-like leader
MSIESAKAFLEKIKSDEEFRNSVGEIGTAEERMEYVKGAGFDFTMEEIATLKDELSDMELDGVAGGFCVNTFTG